MTRALAAAAVAACAVWPAAAAAEPGDTVVVDEEEPKPVYFPELRPGIRKIIGFDFGIGLFDGFCAECRIQGGISADFFAGVQVARRVGIVVDLWSLMHLLPSDSAEDRGFTAHSQATAAARVWVVPAFWIQTGVGPGFLSVVGPQEQIDVGPGAVIAAGGELKHRPNSGIDLSLRLGATRFRIDGTKQYIYNASAVVGYHWN